MAHEELAVVRDRQGLTDPRVSKLPNKMTLRLRFGMSRRLWRIMLVVMMPTVLLPCATSLSVPCDDPAKPDQTRGEIPCCRPARSLDQLAFAGTPDPPPPFTVVPAFPNLKFEFPVALVPAAGTNRLFVGELKGRIYSFPNDPGCKAADLALDVSKLHPDLSAFYGLAFHPQFDKNRYAYACYVRRNDVPDGSIVSRFTASRTDPPVIDPKSEQVILTFWSGGITAAALSSVRTDIFIFRQVTAPLRRRRTPR